MKMSKYKLFFFVGAAMIGAQFAIKKFYSDDQFDWTLNSMNVVLAIVAAWIWEAWAEFMASVKVGLFVSGPRNSGRVRMFILNISILGVGIWAGGSKILNAQNAFDFFLNAAVIYLFSAAFFESLNLLKVGVRN